MPRLLHKLQYRNRRTGGIVSIYAASLLLILHTFLVAYINSSYLEQFVSTEAVGTIYTVGSAVSVLVFLFISRVLRKVGNFKLMLALLLLNLVAVWGMAFAESLRTAVPLFLIHLMAVPLMVFNLDVFMEAQIGNNEGTTGSKRGLLLTLMSFIGAIAPFASSLLVEAGEDTFALAYLVSGAALLPVMLILLFAFKNFSDPPYHEIRFWRAMRGFWENINIRNVLGAHLTLQAFFVAMVIYTPLYLTQTIGLSWTDFGIIMFCAQMAYVLCEYPIGLVADRYIGEREMMGLGFLIMAVSTAWMSFVTTPVLWVWCLIMFITRVGASFVEVTTESYFFKQTKSSDAQIISFFRVTRPLAYVMGALIFSLALLYLPFNLLFIVVASLMIPAMFMTLNIEDTK